jgi:hypothetical protein
VRHRFRATTSICIDATEALESPSDITRRATLSQDRYLNITDEEVRKSLTGVWERRRQLKAVGE